MKPHREIDKSGSNAKVRVLGWNTQKKQWKENFFWQSDGARIQVKKYGIMMTCRIPNRIYYFLVAFAGWTIQQRNKNKLNCWATDLLRYVFRRGIVGKKWVLRRSQIVTQDLCCGMPHGSNVGNGRRRPPDLVFYPSLSQDRRLDFSSHKGGPTVPRLLWYLLWIIT